MARNGITLRRLFILAIICLQFIACSLYAAEPIDTQKSKTMIIEIGTTSLKVELYNNHASRSLLKTLPQEIHMNSWGNEYYGELLHPIDYKGDDLRDTFEIGEIALWPTGNALCIFFGPTPASINGEPRMASPGVALGKIIGDTAVLKKLKGSLSHVKISAEQ